MNTNAMKKRKIIRGIHSFIDTTILFIIIIVLAFAGYSLWDTDQVHQAADSSNYERFKPSEEDEGKSFKELQAINPEVIAWLNVYGTKIDYPVAQGPDNMKYVNTDIEGQFSLSGAIFLDTNNSKDFKDFNNIFYGHFMENQLMFGDLGRFIDREVFERHRYGNLYFEDKDHGIEFFAFLHADAYDRAVFTANVREENAEAYLENLLANAIHERNIDISTSDNIVLLTTCSANSTNGRDILVGRLTDEVFENTFTNIETGKTHELLSIDIQGLSGKAIVILILGVMTLLLIIALTVRNIVKKKKRGKAHE